MGEPKGVSPNSNNSPHRKCIMHEMVEGQLDSLKEQVKEGVKVKTISLLMAVIGLMFTATVTLSMKTMAKVDVIKELATGLKFNIKDCETTMERHLRNHSEHWRFHPQGSQQSLVDKEDKEHGL